MLVTGASSGIGAATATLLRESGDEVIELDVRPRAAGVACDLGERAEVVRAAREIAGPLDGIAHVAGVPGTHPPRRVLAINFLGPQLLTELLLPKVASGGGIAFVSSLAAHRCAWPDAELLAVATEPDWDAACARLAARDTGGSQAYDLSKRLIEFTLPTFVRRALGAGVRVNAVSPGPIETPILDDFRASMGIDRIAAAERPRRPARPAGRDRRRDRILAASGGELDQRRHAGR